MIRDAPFFGHGDLSRVAQTRLPVRFSIGEGDEYYGSAPVKRSYDELVEIYRGRGLSDEEIGGLAVLDVKPASYFSDRGIANQHGGGAALFCRDPEIMGWLFSR